MGQLVSTCSPAGGNLSPRLGLDRARRSGPRLTRGAGRRHSARRPFYFGIPVQIPSTAANARLPPRGSASTMRPGTIRAKQRSAPMSDPDPFLPIFKKLAADMDETTDFPARRLLLAHYTSIAALEGIVARQEVWFS